MRLHACPDGGRGPLVAHDARPPPTHVHASVQRRTVQPLLHPIEPWGLARLGPCSSLASRGICDTLFGVFHVAFAIRRSPRWS